MKQMKQMIKIEKVSASWQNEKVYAVVIDGVKRGLISKFPSDKFTTCPWKAFAMGCLGSNQPNHMFGVFYGPAGRRDAIAAVLANAGASPLFEVIDENFEMVETTIPSRFTDPAYLKQVRNVARSERAIRRAV